MRLSALGRRFGVDFSPERRSRFTTFHTAWRQQLRVLPFDQLTRGAQVDYLLLDARLRYELARQDREAKLAVEMAPLLPFADTLFALLAQRRQLVRPELRDAARRIAMMQSALDQARTRMNDTINRPSRIVALRAAESVADLRREFQAWHRFHAG